MLVLLDACCLINLFATDLAAEILVALPNDFAVARYVVEEEVLEIEGPLELAGSERTDGEQNRVSLSPGVRTLVSGGVLRVLDATSAEETREWVRFATQLDDGEAQTMALAKVRGAGVATDDKKAIRILTEESMDCLGTSELIFGWAEAKGIDDGTLEAILRAVARRASFIPSRSDPHFQRWMGLLRLP